MNKVGSMLNKNLISMGNKKGEANTYKPAGVHVLGEDYFPQDNNMMMNEESLGTNNSEIDRQNTNPGSTSSNILPTVKLKKGVSSSMQEVLGVTKKNQPQQKSKRFYERIYFNKWGEINS